MDLTQLIGTVKTLARAAGEQIMEVYQNEDLGIEYKADDSPLTLADWRSHELLVAGLSQLTDFPILSEEAADVSWAQRQTWQTYWLLDPLDGTKEFIKRNGEFTVNIALIDNGVPVLGAVYVPTQQILYYGVKEMGAFKELGASKEPGNQQSAIPIRVSPLPVKGQRWRLIGSRSHDSEVFNQFVNQFDQPEMKVLGSSLKTCMVAAGLADLYPRFGPTYEWDTAAAQAVVEAAGGRVIDYETKQDLRYNTKESLLNPSFIACAGTCDVWS